MIRPLIKKVKEIKQVSPLFLARECVSLSVEKAKALTVQELAAYLGYEYASTDAKYLPFIIKGKRYRAYTVLADSSTKYFNVLIVPEVNFAGIADWSQSRFAHVTPRKQSRPGYVRSKKKRLPSWRCGGFSKIAVKTRLLGPTTLL